MNKRAVTKEQILDYHAQFPAGKIGTCVTKSLHTPRDIITAYTPGVGIICEEIAACGDRIYQYTNKGNLVGVLSNGTAVLGYGHMGPLAAKPIMEAKAMILKRFAGVDAFDLEIDATSPEEVIQVIKALAPTFGAINLEDIKAPECFQIEASLIDQLDIPIMHDDQHATAIVVAAALLNGLLIANKDITEVQIVFSGAGASAIATAKLLIALGANPAQIVMCDRQGVIRQDRDTLHPIKAPFATDRPMHTLHDAVIGADVFIGLSSGNILMSQSIERMAKDPIIFGLANPLQEISYRDAMATRPDVIFATGRSDFPNQVNNLIAFPYIFRGALDVGASAINGVMQQAAVQAIQKLAQEEVPVGIRKYYGETIHFGKEYILPKPMDTRLLSTVSIAVARAAMDSGIARNPIHDWNAYAVQLLKRVNHQN